MKRKLILFQTAGILALTACVAPDAAKIPPHADNGSVKPPPAQVRTHKQPDGSIRVEISNPQP